jgi:hypothetical protein
MLRTDALDALHAMNAADTPEAAIAEFNAKYMVVNEAGKAVIFAPNRDPVLGRAFYDRMSFTDLRNLYLNRKVVVGVSEEGDPIKVSVATVWLSHPDRKKYIGGVIFDPSGTPSPPDVLNLWTGFAIKPEPGDWSLLRAHIRDVLCSGNEAWDRYLMGWMARMVQCPAEQGEVAVLMRGEEGTGKGTLAKALLHILGQHGIAISNSRHLTGNFNAHLRDALFLFADEAFYAGDPKHVGVLKSLITEPYLTIEGKYQNAVQSPNFLHVMMASNNEWVVPASLTARRFFALDVPDTVRGNHPYFAAIWKQMEAGGYAAMLHDLLHYDLTGFNVRDVPETEALQRQKKLSLAIPESWWLDVLHRGYVWKSKLGLEDTFSTWHEVVATDLLYASYMDFAQQRRERHPMDREYFGRFLVQMKCRPTRARNLITGEHLEDHPQGGRQANVVRRKELSYGYKLGSLELARAGFIATTNLPIDWQEGSAEAAP